MRTRRHVAPTRRAAALALAAALAGSALLAVAPPAAATLADERGLTVTHPVAGARVSGPDVTLTGSVGTGVGDVVAVQLVVDVSGSTATPAAMDCDGDGTTAGTT
jgi:hypothetical protein